MKQEIRIAAVAAAVSAAFAGPVHAATPIYGAGASAVQRSLLYIIMKDYCSTASNLTYYDNGTAPTSSTALPNGSIYRVTCTPVSAAKFTSGLDITYDAAGGAWKGLIAGTPALLTQAQSTQNANPVSTINIGTGTTYGTLTPTILGSVFTFTYVYGASSTSLGTLATSGTNSVTYGLVDAESTIFGDTPFNEPLVNGSWNTSPAQIFDQSAFDNPPPELSGFPVKAFGLTLGVAASPALYKALQIDQVAIGYLPASCSSSYGTIGSATNPTCVPFISRSQYASLVSANFGALNTNAAGLFQSVTPTDTSIEIARLNQGSGTEAASNAYFLGQGCASTATEASDLAPALPSDLGVVPATNSGTNTNVFQVSYSSSAGGVVTRLAPVAATASSNPGVTSGFVIGGITGERDGNLGGAGFLRVDGFYPTQTNVLAGVYNFFTSVLLHANPSAAGDALTFVKDLGGLGTAPSNEWITNYSGTGVVNLTTSNYNNNGTLCAGLRHI